MQKYLDKFERKITNWLKPMPHLPKNTTKWIAKNVWWIVTIMVAFSIIGIMSNLYGVINYANFIENAPSYVGIYNDTLYADYWLYTTIVALAFTIAATYYYYKSITLLKAMQKAGWDLLFLVFAINVVRVVVVALVGLNVLLFITSLIFGAIMMAVAAYLLFELKPHFKK